MTERILQRVVMPPRRDVTRLYYRADGGVFPPRPRDRRALGLRRGTALRTDTWFNAFFESYWRKYTSLAQLMLRLRVSGTGTLRLYRRTSQQELHLLEEIDFSGRDRELNIELADARPTTWDFGLLFFEIVPRSSSLIFHQAEWAARASVNPPMRLAAGFCTFNRASQLLRNITTLFADADAAELLERVIIVDQGAKKVREHPDFAGLVRTAAGRLNLVEQDNRGGAGGFTRCLLEAQIAGDPTHILLMDDDIVAEPESVLRAAAFLSLAHTDMVLGGHMLDLSRPCQVVETGSRYLPQQVRIDEPRRHCVDREEDLTNFLEPRTRHYNGWWFCAFPLSVVKRAGLPLPLFLRGDDVEYGCRLLRHGVPTVALPGVAVWHEPFERKGRSWYAYYELRNYLIVGALHFPYVRAATVARRFLSRMIDELLAYDYYEAWLLCEAVTAYLCGPELLRRPPLVLHDHLRATGEKLASPTYPREGTERSECSPSPTIAPRFARAWRWRLMFRNLWLASPSLEAHPQRLLQGGGEQWYDVGNADVVGVAESWCSRMVLLRRSRGRFVRLLVRGIGLAFRLFAGHRRAVRRWRAGASVLTSQAFWTEYIPNATEPRPFGSGGRGCVSAPRNRSRTAAARITDREGEGDTNE